MVEIQADFPFLFIGLSVFLFFWQSNSVESKELLLTVTHYRSDGETCWLLWEILKTQKKFIASTSSSDFFVGDTLDLFVCNKQAITICNIIFQKWRFQLLLFAFNTGNGSLEPLLEGPLSQIHMDLGFRITGRLLKERESWEERERETGEGTGCVHSSVQYDRNCLFLPSWPCFWILI